MKNVLIALVVLSVVIVASPLYAQITFERWYGGNARDYGYSVAQTSDGGYIITGETTSYGTGAYDVYLIRTDEYGDTIWTRTYGGTATDYGRSVIQTSDAGFVVVGAKLPDGGGYFDVYLIKTDSLGDTLWTKTYGHGPHDYGTSVSQTSDEGFIITGYTEHAPFFHHVYLIKTDSLGNTNWTRTYGGTYDERGNSVSQTLDGGYIIAGETSSFGEGSYDVYLIKTDSLGDTLWTTTYGDTGYDIGSSVVQTTDGGFIISGETSSYGAGFYDVYLIKTDTIGDTSWTRTYGGTDADGGESVAQTFDGGYIISGFTSYAIDSYDVYLIKTDTIGDTSWTRTYGGAGYEWSTSVAQCTDGGYIIAGHTDSYGAGLDDVYLIKTDSLGVGIHEDKEQKQVTRDVRFTISPNPFTTSTIIRISALAQRAKSIDLQIFDVSGRRIRDFILYPSSFILETTWNGRDEAGNVVSPGIYFVRLESGNFTATQKLILVR